MPLKFYETQPVHCPHCGKGVSVTLERDLPNDQPIKRAARFRCDACDKDVSTWLPGLIVRTESLKAVARGNPTSHADITKPVSSLRSDVPLQWRSR